MKSTLLFILLFYLVPIYSQTFNSTISEIVNQVSLDSLVKHVRILSGEDSVLIDGKKHLITNRISNTKQPETKAHYLASRYLLDYLNRYLSEVYEQDYLFRSDTIRNIIGVQEGITHPEKKVIISGHYDSILWTYIDTLAPGADDNASGTAVVLESARLFSQIETDFTIYFILWDWEEVGCTGSENFVFEDVTKDDIIYMINLDMIGYDVQDSGYVDLYYGDDKNPLIFIVDSINTLYDIQLRLLNYFINGPGDVVPFIQADICPTLMFLQRYRYYIDDNPYYHTKNDKIEHFNLNYYHKVAKLGIATTLEIALNGIPSSIKNDNNILKHFKVTQNYPNPFNNSTTIAYSVPNTGFITFSVFDLKGNKLDEIILKVNLKERNYIQYNAGRMPSGLYLYQLKYENYLVTKKMIIMK